MVGVREINDADLPSTSWVNTTLQYTHGYGMIVSPSNTATIQRRSPVRGGDVPPVSTSGLPVVTQPSVYFGLNNSGYVVANTKQPEIDYQLTNGTNVETHYKGDGGVQLSNFFNQAMFAIRFSDLNLLISNQITNDSRLMFDRGVQARVSKAAPFLSLDADPYPVLLNGHIDWVQDAYTTTDNYPYSQNADTSALPAGSGLNQNFNYVRNSVKVLINAYTGKMTFYVMDPNDPIIQTYEKAFPGMFTPASKMSADLRAHLRYPEDIFTVQATMYGKYHITRARASTAPPTPGRCRPSPGSGSPSQALATTLTTNAQGQQVSTGQLVRMAPIYQELRVPGQAQQSFTLLDAFVPVSGQSQIQTLSGFMIAGSDPGHYGQLQMFVTPREQSGQRTRHRGGKDRRHAARSPSRSSLLNQNGSSVLLGNVLMIPVANSLLYIQPLYVESSRNAVPGAATGDRRIREQPVAIAQTLSGRSDHGVPGAGVDLDRSTGDDGRRCPRRSGRCSTRPRPAYQQAQTDLKAGNLGAYQTDITALESDLAEVQQLTGGTVGRPPPPPRPPPAPGLDGVRAGQPALGARTGGGGAGRHRPSRW